MTYQEIGKTFGRGLIFVLPVVLTLYLLWWMGSEIESVAGRIIAPIPFVTYYPGMGLVMTVAIVFVVGLLMKAAIFRQLYGLFEAILERLPLIKTLYGSLRDLMDFFSGDKAEQMNQVVMVDVLGDGSQRLIGFVTRETFDDLPEGLGGEDHVAVYLPMSYQLGGFTTIVPRKAVTPLDMKLDAAMQFALTAGVKKTTSGK